MARRRRPATTSWVNPFQQMMSAMAGAGSRMMGQMMGSAVKKAGKQMASAVSASNRLAGHGSLPRRGRTDTARQVAAVMEKAVAGNVAAAGKIVAAQAAGARAAGKVLKSVRASQAAAAVPAGTRVRRKARPVEPHRGLAVSAGGVRRYQLWVPPGTRARQRLPLVVMLHGCQQDIDTFRAQTRMNRLADRAGFGVLYVEQDRVANPMGCWNWFALDTGKALSEVSIIRAAIRDACQKYPLNPEAVSLVGLSAGAGMAALTASRHPDEFVAVAMHAGVPPGSAREASGAMAAMRGERLPDALLHVEGGELPALLVVQGIADGVVDPANAGAAARQWASACGAKPRPSRVLRRGSRYPMIITDYVVNARLRVRLCEIEQLGHAWSGADARHDFSDPLGPDASRLTWAFIADVLRQRQPVARKPAR